jgi:transcriptional regulator with XRE-family HTH domain
MDEKGLTRAALAKRLGKTEDAVKKLLAGQAQVQFEKLIELATALGTTPNTLLGFSEAGERDALLAALAVSYEALGLDHLSAVELSEIVLQAAQDARIHRADMPTPAAARVLASVAVSKFRKQ